MAQPFFGRRESDATGIRPSHTTAATGLSTGPSAGPAVPVALQSSSQAPASAAGPESAARLIVGPHIKLKGLEITDCDTLLVEGSVEATMKSRVIEIAEIGTFKGEAEIDMAEFRFRHYIATTGSVEYEEIVEQLREDYGRFYAGIHEEARDVIGGRLRKRGVCFFS